MKICIADCLVSKADNSEEKYKKYKSLPTGILFRTLLEHKHEVYICPSFAKPSLDVDIFHAHNLGFTSLYLAVNKKRPLVFTSHNGLITCRYKSLKAILAKILIGPILRNADLIIALCERESNVFQEDYGINPGKIKIIHNGINFEYYINSHDKKINKNVKLLCVAHLERYKGIEYLIEALKLAKKEYDSIELDIVSIGQKRLRQYQELAKSLSLVENVNFLGPQSTEQLTDMFYSCDIYIQPSIAEDFPTVILEAMACGKPVIASDVGGISEQVTNETGILVSPKDIVGLATAIKELAGNQELREKMGLQGKSRALSYFNKNIMYEKHIEAYTEAMIRYNREDINKLQHSINKILINMLYALLMIKNSILKN